MNKVNFDGLKSIKAPEEWIEKASVIPETHVRKRVFPVYRAVAAASVVLAGIVGTVVFMQFGTGTPVAVRSESTVETMTQTDFVQTEHAASESTALSPAETVVIPGGIPSENSAIIVQSSSESAAPENAEPTDGAAIARSTVPSAAAAPTQRPTQLSAQTTAPEPTVSPTQPPAPTSPPEPTSSPVPWEEDPTVNSPDSKITISAAAAFPASKLYSDETVFCVITENGTPISAGVAHYVILDNGMAFAEYDSGIEPEPGKVYRFIFTGDSGGNYVAASRTFAQGTLQY